MVSRDPLSPVSPKTIFFCDASLLVLLMRCDFTCGTIRACTARRTSGTRRPTSTAISKEPSGPLHLVVFDFRTPLTLTMLRCFHGRPNAPMLVVVHVVHQTAPLTFCQRNKCDAQCLHDTSSLSVHVLWHVQWFGRPVEDASGISLLRMHS